MQHNGLRLLLAASFPVARATIASLAPQIDTCHVLGRYPARRERRTARRQRDKSPSTIPRMRGSAGCAEATDADTTCIQPGLFYSCGTESLLLHGLNQLTWSGHPRLGDRNARGTSCAAPTSPIANAVKVPKPPITIPRYPDTSIPPIPHIPHRQ